MQGKIHRTTAVIQAFRIVLVGLFILALMAPDGQFTALRIKRFHHRREVSVRMGEDAGSMKWQWLVVEKDSIAWEVEGKEFWYQGHLYDVKEWSAKANTITALCTRDECEEKMVQRIWLGHLDPSQLPQLVWQTFMPIIKYIQPSQEVPTLERQISVKDGNVYGNRGAQSSPDVPYPPPKAMG